MRKIKNSTKAERTNLLKTWQKDSTFQVNVKTVYN